MLEFCFTIATLDLEASQQRNIQLDVWYIGNHNVDPTPQYLPIMADFYLGDC